MKPVTLGTVRERKRELHSSKIKKGSQKAVTLIALVVTIVTLLILAGVTIATLTGENGIITKAYISKMQTELAGYKEEVDLYKLNKKTENREFNEESLTAGKETINYNTKKDGETGNIKTIITNIDDKYLDSIKIIKGKITIKTSDNNQIKAAKAVGIEANPYDITDDGEFESTNNNLVLVDNEGTLTLPDYVTKIGNGAFSGVKGIKKIILPPSVVEIGANAFSNNEDLEEVVIQGELKTIGASAFAYTKNLTRINLPDSINDIGQWAFRNSGIKQITIPKNVTNLGGSVFLNCPLTNVTLQEGIKYLGRGCFEWCEFKSISFPSTLISVDSTAFNNCNNLNNIDLSKNENFVLESGMLLNKERNNVIFVMDNVIKNLDTFEIPEGIEKFDTNIAKYVNITKITIPKSLNSLEPSSFPTSIDEVEVVTGKEAPKFIAENGILYNDQNQLIMCYSKNTDITIQEGITSIGGYAFKQATKAKNLNLPHSLTQIAGRSLEYLYSIENINIKESVNFIHPLFRTYLSGKINIDNEKYVVENNILYEKKDGVKYKIVKVLYKIDGTMQIESGITTLGLYAFYGQKEIKNIIIPNGVTTIENNSFSNCPKLNMVDIPSSVTSIGKDCFSDSTNSLEQIIIHNSENAISGSPWGAIKGAKAVIWKPDK